MDSQHPANPKTDTKKYLLERVEQHAQDFPSKPALVWVNAKGQDEHSYTYAQFLDASRRLAVELLQEGLKRGDTAILAYTPCLDFYIAFWACMEAGIIAVPVNPPFSNSDVKKFLRIVNNSNARVLLTDKLFARLVTMKIRKHKAKQIGKGLVSMFGRNADTKTFTFGDLESLWWITTSGMSSNQKNISLEPQPVEETAFIMYSSGSTSAPKGALTTMVNLQHQFDLIEEALESSPDHVCAWWAPHFHDFGLISGFLNSLNQGCKSVITSPMFFIQRPALWLDMMHNHKATHTFGPDFGYLLLVNKTTQEEREVEKWDLSHLKVAMSAAEKVRYATLKSFTDAFAGCGFRAETFCPAYGLAEHAVGVTINSLKSLPQVLNVQRTELENDGEVVANSTQDDAETTRLKQLVGSGRAWNETDVRIILLDDEGTPLSIAPQDRVGEIWVSSLSKTLGYHKLPDTTEEVFHARLPGSDPSSDDGKKEYLRTGDLGFISSENGELFVCGRNKDMIIIAGKNHYSEDMELNISEALTGYLRPGCIAAFAVESQETGEEELHIVAEVTNHNVDLTACFQKIHECIAREHHINVSTVTLINSKSIPKTSSGKIRRFLVREMLLAGKLNVVSGGTWQNDNPAEPVAPKQENITKPKVSSPVTPNPPPVAAEKTVSAVLAQPDESSKRESDFPKLLLDFKNFSGSHGAPAAFPVYFPECGPGYEHWSFLVGTKNLALLFDEDKFYRMPVWNFTAPAPEIFHDENFPRWANGQTHRKMKSRLAEIVEELMPTTISRTLNTTNRFMDRWAARKSFPWLPEFNEFTTALFCEVFTGKMLTEAPDLFTTVLYGVDPFRKNSFESQKVTREDNVAQGMEAKAKLSEFLVGKNPTESDTFDADLLIGSGGFAVIPALKNVLINLYAILSSEPEIRQRVVEELRLLRDPLERDALTKNTPLLEACIWETIRLHPPVGHYYARAREDIVVDGLHIPKDSNVVGHTWYSYHDPALYKNPHLFDPDRFMEPRNEHIAGDNSFDPFGSGDPLNGHACPGKDLATLLVKTTIAQSLLEYDWELSKPAWDDTQYRERYGVPNYEDGMQVNDFRKRDSNDWNDFFNADSTEESMTLDELRSFNGEDDKPIYIAILGKVYDVSSSADFYGEGGPYEVFAGRDASRALATMSLEEEDLDNPDITSLTPSQMDMLKQWHDRLASKYPLIGNLVKTKATKPNKKKKPRLEAPMDWRVAIVGGGISGLATALALSEYGYKVTVFEKNLSLGGHACTKPVGAHMRQPAFGMFMAKQWPNALSLMDKVGIKPIVECPADQAIRHFSKDGHTIAQESIEKDITRFYYDMTRMINDPEADGVTIGNFFKEQEYSHEFICYYFVGKVIHYFAGQSLDYYLSYPLRLIAWMYLGMTANENDDVMRVDNQEYMNAIKAMLQSRRVQVVNNTNVSFITRDQNQAILGFNGGKESFGHVVLAVQPHHALKILGPCATKEEENILSQFEYTVDTAVLHFDDSWVPENKKEWGLLNFLLPDKGQSLPEPSETIPITTPFVSDTDGRTPIFCTYNYANAEDWEGDGPHWKYTFEHTKVTPATQLLRRELKMLQGKQRVQYCGSWSRGLTLHEDAVVTGLQAANRILGIDRQYIVKNPGVVQPAPFQNAEDDFGSTIEDIVENLNGILQELKATSEKLTVDTDLQALGLSSLDIGRLVNAVNSRVSSGTISVEELYALDTLGEVAEYILNLDDSDPIFDELRHSPSLTARASGGKPDGSAGMQHPVSMAQLQILQSHFMATQESSHWNIPMRTWLHGKVDEEALKKSFQLMARRQSVLRTRFNLLEDGSFCQRIDAKIPGDFFESLSSTNHQEAIELAKQASTRPMDVSHGVIRVTLIHVDSDTSLLVLVVHHAVSDGWSLGIIVRELWEFYNGLCEDKAPEELSLPHLPLQFVDYSYWQQELQKHHHYDNKLEYWRRELSSPAPVLGLSNAKTKAGNTAASTLAFYLIHEQVDALRALSRKNRTSLNVVLLTAYAVSLCRQSGQDAVLIQVPVAGRENETEALVGCFADALILKISCLADQTFDDYIQQTHRQLYDGIKHAVPMGLLLNELELRPAEKLKIHRAVLHWEQTLSLRDTQEVEKGGLRSEPFDAKQNEEVQIAAQSHSVLNINETPEGMMRAEWLFSKSAIDDDTMHALVRTFRELLSQRPDQPSPPPAAPAPAPV
ncbi:MAG: cytochrome P450, partial [Deltaproteobacteria bacterium]|nr:cytochrome P450 [Deltaproteobacteria bacterium]